MRVSAYVIHTRPFQDSKILLDMLTLEQGLIRGVWAITKKRGSGHTWAFFMLRDGVFWS